MTQNTVPHSATVIFTPDGPKIDLGLPSITDLVQAFLDEISQKKLSDQQRKEPNFPFSELKPISPIKEKVDDFDTFLHGIRHIVENIEDPYNLSKFDILFLEFYKALTQYGDEAGKKLYYSLIEEGIWYKDKSGTIHLDTDGLEGKLYQFFQAQGEIPFTPEPEILPELICQPEEQDFQDFLNSIKTLVENPENDALQPYFDALYALAQSPMGYKLFNDLRETIWFKDESGTIHLDTDGLIKTLDKLFDGISTHEPEIILPELICLPENTLEIDFDKIDIPNLLKEMGLEPSPITIEPSLVNYYYDFNINSALPQKNMAYLYDDKTEFSMNEEHIADHTTEDNSVFHSVM